MTMKVTNWPQAVVAIAGLAAVAGLVAFLVRAGWNSEAIVAFAALALGQLIAQVATARKAGQIHDTVTTVERRTNGELDERIAAAMEEAAEAGAARALAALRKERFIR